MWDLHREAVREKPIVTRTTSRQTGGSNEDTRWCVLRMLYPRASLLEPGVGIEPTTYALRVRCSATELPRRALHAEPGIDPPVDLADRPWSSREAAVSHGSTL